jgi:hypothetical protein
MLRRQSRKQAKILSTARTATWETYGHIGIVAIDHNFAIGKTASCPGITLRT